MADVVFFDAAGTLFRVKGSVGEIYSRVAAKYGLMADSEAVEAEFRAAFHAKTSEGLLPGETGLRAEKAWWLDVVLRTFAGKMPPEAMNAYFDEVFETFRGAGAWELFEETRACLQHLRSWGYRLAVISNFDSRLFDVLANLSIDSFFEQVILSWHAGSAKPDQAIFRRALEAVHAVAADALHVGDSLSEDVAGAAAAGLKAALLDRYGKHREWQGSPRLETLEELPSLLTLMEHRNG